MPKRSGPARTGIGVAVGGGVAVGKGVAVGGGVAVAVGSGVGVAVGSGVDVLVGVGIGVKVGNGVGVGSAASGPAHDVNKAMSSSSEAKRRVNAAGQGEERKQGRKGAGEKVGHLMVFRS